MSFRNSRIGAAVLAILLPFWGAYAQETTTYTYDARGRLVTVSKSGGPSSGVEATYVYDKAGNRTNVTVINSPNGGGDDPNDGASTPPSDPLYVVVPLNGYTLIRIR